MQEIPAPRTKREIKEDLDRRFSYHPASTNELAEAHEAVRTKAKSAAAWVCRNLPEGREQALAVTHLEEFMFWANAGIARHGLQQ